MQNGDINHRIQVIEQNEKDIPFLYPLIHYGDFCLFWIDISKKIDISKFSIYRNFRYWSGQYDTIRYIDIEMIYRYFWYIDPSLHEMVCAKGMSYGVFKRRMWYVIVIAFTDGMLTIMETSVDYVPCYLEYFMVHLCACVFVCI